MSNFRSVVLAFVPIMTASRILQIRNVETRRVMMEAMPLEQMVSEAEVIHSDVDEQGNPRSLLRLPCDDAVAGHILCCRVICPSTGRVYHLLVDPAAKTCEAAVDSTFELVGEFVARHT